MKTPLTIFTLVFTVMFSTSSFAHSPYYQLFVISVEKGFYADLIGSISNKLFKGITQFETSKLGGGKFPSKEKCIQFLKKLVVQSGGPNQRYKINYKNIMVEDTGDGYHTERHCILIE